MSVVTVVGPVLGALLNKIFHDDSDHGAPRHFAPIKMWVQCSGFCDFKKAFAMICCRCNIMTSLAGSPDNAAPASSATDACNWEVLDILAERTVARRNAESGRLKRHYGKVSHISPTIRVRRL